jgi:hypothetical protein
MRIFSNTILLDKTGILVSALCAVHCLFIPILLSLSMFSGLKFLGDPKLENTILVISSVLGASSLFPSYFKHHRNLAAIGILLFGLLLIGLSRFKVNDVYEVILTSTGAATVASAHFMNFKVCKNSHKMD